MTYGRSVAKALAVFDISSAKWPALAADRVAWRATLKSGQPPDEYSARPPTPTACRPAAGVRPRSPLHHDRDQRGHRPQCASAAHHHQHLLATPCGATIAICALEEAYPFTSYLTRIHPLPL